MCSSNQTADGIRVYEGDIGMLPSPTPDLIQIFTLKTAQRLLLGPEFAWLTFTTVVLREIVLSGISHR